MKQQREIQHVIELISRWITQVRLSSALTFYDINKISEDFACKLLNEIYDYELVNLNIEKRNFPGIDLGDKSRSLIAFQVSSRTDGEKIRGTLRTFVEKGYDKIFTKGVRFLVLNQETIKFGKQDPKRIYSQFCKSKHVLTDKGLIRDISNIYNNNPEKFNSIKELLENEFGEKPNVETPDTVVPPPSFNTNKFPNVTWLTTKDVMQKFSLSVDELKQHIENGLPGYVKVPDTQEPRPLNKDRDLITLEVWPEQAESMIDQWLFRTDDIEEYIKLGPRVKP
ncbi:MAG: SMEK domain-containing protein [Desulfobacula sp.]|jgi:hypothetical protein|nr:SMEK domain-containing protein [Desulfobacula sp.]